MLFRLYFKIGIVKLSIVSSLPWGIHEILRIRQVGIPCALQIHDN